MRLVNAINVAKQANDDDHIDQTSSPRAHATKRKKL